MKQFFNGVFHAAHRVEGIEVDPKTNTAYVNLTERISDCECEKDCYLENTKQFIHMPTHRLLLFAAERHIWAGYYTFDRNQSEPDSFGGYLFLGTFTDGNPMISIFNIC